MTNNIYRLFCLLQFLLLAQCGFASNNEPKEMVIFLNDHRRIMVRNSMVDSITYTKMIKDSTTCVLEDVQEIWMEDSVIRLFLSDIDSLSFHKPSTILQDGVWELNDELMSYVQSSDTASFLLREDVPQMYLPPVGEKIVVSRLCDAFPGGFVGRVKSIEPTNEGILVSCDTVSLTNIFKRYYTTFARPVSSSSEMTSKKRVRVFDDPISKNVHLIKFEKTYKTGDSWEWSTLWGTKSSLSKGIRADLSAGLPDAYVTGYYTLDLVPIPGDPFFPIYDLSFSLVGDYEAGIQFSLFGEYSLEKDLKAFEWDVPIPLTPGIYMSNEVGVTMGFTGTISTSVSLNYGGKLIMSCNLSNNPFVKHNIKPVLKLRMNDKYCTLNGISLDGSLNFGLYYQCGVTVLQRQLLNVGLRMEGGGELSASANFFTLDPYRIGINTADYERYMNDFTWDLNWYLKPTLRATLGSMEIAHEVLPTIKGAKPIVEGHLVPTFDTVKGLYDDDAKCVLFADIDGTVVPSIPVGFRVFDKDGNVVWQDYYNDDYLDVPLVKPSDFHSYQMEMPDGILKLNKEYTAYPLVKLFNHFEAIAPPAAIIGLYAYPYTDEEGSVTSSSAVVYGHLLDENHICGNAIVGFLYGKSSDLIHTGNRVVCHMDGNRKFQLGLNNLEDGTRYYYQAFMEFKDSIYYGEVKSFETPEIPDDAVDLGLSVLWAKRNVGASSESDFGGLYGWADPSGENTSYDVMGDDGYTWVSSLYGGPSPVTNISGTSYDIATMKWGGKWRMPTQQEMVELIDNCQWTPTYKDGVPGMLVTADSGNSIFLPAAGDRFGTSRRDTGQRGYYWTSTLNTEQRRNAYRLDFGLQADDYDWNSYARYIGICVRPVMDITN